MCGHYARGVLAAPGDRLVRIIDWMLRQPGRGPQHIATHEINEDLDAAILRWPWPKTPLRHPPTR